MDYREYYDSRSRERKKNRRFRMKPRFFAMIAVLLVVIILLFVIFGGQKEYLVVYGAFDATGEGFDALIIRDEIPYYSDTYGQASYKVVEGQSVRAGDAVLDLFASDYISQLLADLQDVRDSIRKHQEDSLLSKIVDPELDQYNAQIQQLVDVIAGFGSGKTADIAATELQLSEAMTQRQNYLKSTSVAQADSALTELYANETQLLGRIEAWRTAYLAPQSGRVSVYFDGLESVLTVNTAATMTYAQALTILGGEMPDVTQTGQALYRLVDPGEWYLLFTAPTSQWQTGVGQEVLVNIDGYSSLNATAVVARIDYDEKQTSALVVLQVGKDIGSLIGERFTHITIGSNTEGLMVPRKAVKQEGASYGVYLMDGTFVAVDLLASDPDYYIVMPIIEGALDKGMTIKAK